MGHQDTNKLYLIDFGLSTPFIDDEGVHLKKINTRKFCGNFMFASLNSLRGNSQSRRDDIESALYLLIYLINNSRLPWSDFNTKFSGLNMSLSDYLRERLKKKYYTFEQFKLPKDLHDCLKLVLRLRFDSEPPYKYILQCINQCYKKAVSASTPTCPTMMSEKVYYPNIENYIFEWNHTIGNRFRMSLLAQDNGLMQDIDIWVRSQDSSQKSYSNMSDEHSKSRMMRLAICNSDFSDRIQNYDINSDNKASESESGKSSYKNSSKNSDNFSNSSMESNRSPELR